MVKGKYQTGSDTNTVLTNKILYEVNTKVKESIVYMWKIDLKTCFTIA